MVAKRTHFNQWALLLLKTRRKHWKLAHTKKTWSGDRGMMETAINASQLPSAHNAIMWPCGGRYVVVRTLGTRL